MSLSKYKPKMNGLASILKLEQNMSVGKKLRKYLGYFTSAPALALFISCADYDTLNINPPPAVTLSVASAQDSTVTLRWTQCTDENFKMYEVLYDTNEDVGVSSPLADSLTFSQDTQKTVHGLRAATNYYFRVIVMNQAGKITPSNTVNAGTWLVFYPTQWLGDTAVSLSWTPLKNMLFSGYKIFSDTMSTVDTTKPLWLQSLSSDTATSVKNIPVGTKRYFRVYAYDSHGYLTTSEIAPVAGWQFTLYAPTRVADTAVQLTWSKVASGVQSYRIFSRNSAPVDTTDSLCAAITTGDTSVILGNFSSGSTHAFRVYARNASAYFAWTGTEQINLGQ